jgi:homoserine dehydrogenase
MLRRRLAPGASCARSRHGRSIIRTYNLCLLGFGNVNRTLLRLLQKKDRELRQRGIAWRITGVATRKMGWIADPNGLDIEAMLSESFGGQSQAGVPAPLDVRVV